MSDERAPRSRRWSDMVDEEEEEEWTVSEASSHRSYSDVVRDGSPSPVRVESPEIPRSGGASSSRPQPVRQLASVVTRPVSPRAAGGDALCGHGGWRGPQPKRQRHRGPLPSFVVPAGVPAGFAGLCFNCAEPGHVAGMCTGPRRCLNCKSEDHVACKCPQAVAPVAGEVAHGAPPPPRGGPPPPVAPAAADAGPRVASGVHGERYRVPARQRLGPREGSPPPPLHPSLQGHLGDRGAVPVAERQATGPPAPRGVVEVVAETPFERGLRLEREIRTAPPLRPEDRVQGVTLYDQERHREQELRAAALLSTERRLAPVVAADVEAARPARERGIIYRTQGVESAERALRWGLVAFVSGTRRAVSCAAASAAIIERFPELEGHFSVHGYWPADLLLVFDSRANRDVLLTAAANPFDGRYFSLRFGVWNRQLQATRRCEVAYFPFKYLGLPLGLRKVTAAQLQPVVDSAASRLQPWCAKLLNRGGRTILVQTTLSAIPVHAMMSLDIPLKVFEVLRKICRAFLWKGRQEINGGHCLVTWDKVASPKALGGLGIPNLRLLNLALRCRWAWLQKVDPSKAWAEFNIQLPSVCTVVFDAATCYILGNGERARFWTDRWLDGAKVSEIALNVAKMVSRRRY
ncbi:hypothetical protein ACQ4PT_021037 [Festuca glaucescens]